MQRHLQIKRDLTTNNVTEANWLVAKTINDWSNQANNVDSSSNYLTRTNKLQQICNSEHKQTKFTSKISTNWQKNQVHKQI